MNKYVVTGTLCSAMVLTSAIVYEASNKQGAEDSVHIENQAEFYYGDNESVQSNNAKAIVKKPTRKERNWADETPSLEMILSRFEDEYARTLPPQPGVTELGSVMANLSGRLVYGEV